MSSTPPQRSPAPSARDGFGQVLRAEWTKLRTVPRWALAMLAAVVLTVGFGLFVAAGSSTDMNTVEPRPFVVSPDGDPVVDNFTFVHQPLSGDGSVIARVLTQDNKSEPWAAAGVMVKASLTSGSRYAALAVTPEQGVRLRANFRTDRAVGAGGAPRWLKLTRSGTSVTGYESADGTTWREVGTVSLAGLPQTVEVGLFVSSPDKITVERTAGGTSTGGHSTESTATFDNVRLEAAQPSPPGAWRQDDIGQSFSKPKPVLGQDRPSDPGPTAEPGPKVDAGLIEEGGVFTVTGTGDMGPNPPPDDVVELSLIGVLVGLMAIVAVGVLFMTSEYKRGMIRTTLAVSRGRGRVLAAKAVILGITAFGLGLVSTVAAFLVTQPLVRTRGFAPPAFPYVSLFDGPVLRALIGTAVFLSAIAVFSLAVGAIVRHSAGAITTVIVLVILPIFVANSLPVSATKWVMLLTPTGGLAIQRAKPPTDVLAEPWSAISPWAGLGAVCGYATVSMIVAFVLLRRRDA